MLPLRRKHHYVVCVDSLHYQLIACYKMILILYLYIVLLISVSMSIPNLNSTNITLKVLHLKCILIFFGVSFKVLHISVNIIKLLIILMYHSKCCVVLYIVLHISVTMSTPIIYYTETLCNYTTICDHKYTQVPCVFNCIRCG